MKYVGFDNHLSTFKILLLVESLISSEISNTSQSSVVNCLPVLLWVTKHKLVEKKNERSYNNLHPYAYNKRNRKDFFIFSVF